LSASAVAERHHQHRDAERVGEQDELLALVIAGLPDARQELDRGHPLIGLQIHLARQRVGVADNCRDDLLEPRVGIVGQAVEDRLRDIGNLVLCHGVSLFQPDCKE